MHRDKRLLITATPYDDESFVGYLLRLTERNHYETLSWILQLAEIRNYAQGKFSLTFISSLNLSPLEKLTGIEGDKLRRLPYSPVKAGGKRYNYSIFGNSVPPYMIRLRYPKICPCCLMESVYLRKIWELAAITVCPVHKSMLLDECPSCNKRITWSRNEISKCKCKFDWRECEPLIVGGEELKVAKQVYRLCNLISEDGTNSRRSRIDCPLYELELDQYLSSLFFIAGQFNGVMDTRGKRVATSLRNSEIHTLLHKAREVFENWPNNFFTFLDWKRATNPDARHVRGLRRDFGQYKSALYVQLSSSCYSFLREAFEEYIAVYWEGGYTTALSRLNENARLKKRYLTKIEVKRMLNVTPKSVDRLIAAGKLLVAKQGQSVPKIVLIEATSAQQFHEKLKGALNLRQTEKRLGLYREPVLQLVEDGLLNPLRGPTVDGCNKWQFSREEVNDLLGLLISKVQQADRLNKGETLDLENTLRKLRRIGCNYVTLAKAILQGEILPCGKRREPGISGLLFSAEQITNYVLGKLWLKIGKAHSIRDVAGFLKISDDAAYHLAKNGILKSKVYPGLSAFGQLITEEELAGFISTYYVLTKSAAQELGTNTTYIAKLLAKKGVTPISAREVDGGWQRVYKKADVAQINLSNLIYSSRPANFKKRPKPGVFSLIDVGKFLGVSSKTTQKLVENGFIKPYTRRSLKIRGEGKYHVPYRLMEACNRLGIKYISLLSTQVAAKIIGISTITLLHYVKTGRLSPILGKDERHHFYFMKADVEAFRRLRKTMLKTGEAAEVLGISRALLFILTLRGTITPVSGPRVDGVANNIYLKKDVEKVRLMRLAQR
jgi:hypothetical protein